MSGLDPKAFELYRHGLATGHTYWTMTKDGVFIASGYIPEDQRMHYYVGSANQDEATSGLFTDGVHDAVNQMLHLSDQWVDGWRPHVERLYNEIMGDNRELQGQIDQLNDAARINADIVGNLHAQLFALRDKLAGLGYTLPEVEIEGV